MEGAYRFFDNDKFSPEKILQSHIEATRERIAKKANSVVPNSAQPEGLSSSEYPEEVSHRSPG